MAFMSNVRVEINSIWDNDLPRESCFRIALDGRCVVLPEDSS